MSALRRLVLVCAVIGALLGCSGSPSPGSPKSAIEKLHQAIQAGDEAAAKGVFTAEAWDRADDSGRHFYEQAARKKFALQPKEPRVQGARAVVETDVVIDGKVRDTVYFYAVQDGSDWKLAAMDENARHVDHYLAGRLPALFDLKGMPSSPELDELAKNVAEWLGKPIPTLAEYGSMSEEQKKAMFVGLAGPPEKSAYNMLPGAVLELKNPQALSSHWVEGIGRGAIVLAKQGDHYSRFTMYFEKKADGWRLLGMTTYPSAETIVGDFK
ncbi:MAG: hypothetical protein RDV41_02320 [Planctomycetota bacterium]|nr:hypothetical protein [Planctomycetota bacterium]